MCSECEDAEVCCRFCGVTCGGTCDDPDSCPSCWTEEYFGESFGEEELDGCYQGGCNCDCHGDWFNHHLRPIVYSGLQDQTPFVRQGVFPFLMLAGELRDKIYHLVLQQTGKDRTSINFKGTVDTAILSTCRQINKEARHIPLTTTKLSFLTPFQALHFLGIQLAPNQRHLVKALHLQINGWADIYGVPLKHLMTEFGKIPLKHLSVTVTGAIDMECFKKNSAIEQRLLLVRGLESFNILIGSGVIDAKDKKKIVEGMQRRMIEKGTLVTTTTLKRTASMTSEDMHRERPAKAAKTLPHVSSFTRTARKTKGTMIKDGEGNDEPSAPMQQVHKENELKKRYDVLAEYAHAFDFAASSVYIRLKQAHQAAEMVDEETFGELASSIIRTLEEQTAKIMKARNEVFSPVGLPIQ